LGDSTVDTAKQNALANKVDGAALLMMSEAKMREVMQLKGLSADVYRRVCSMRCLQVWEEEVHGEVRDYAMPGVELSVCFVLGDGAFER
jgi:hypothetical protein